MLTHDQVVAAARYAAEVERDIAVDWTFMRRILWLTEAELAARMHTDISRSTGQSPANIRMCAQGRLAAGATNHDLEVFAGMVLVGAIEVVWCIAAKGTDACKQQPARPLNEDVSWLLSSQVPCQRHAVVFFPRMMAGYSVQNRPRPFDLAGREFDQPRDRVLLTGVLQATALSAEARGTLSGIVEEVSHPAAGNSTRWTLAEGQLPAPGNVSVNGIAVKRTVVLSPASLVWSVVLSKC